MGMIVTPALPLTAQTSDDLLSLLLTPEQPGPYEEVALILHSSIYDLTISEISWYLDGELRVAGIGKVGSLFTVGSLGSSASIEARVVTEDKDTLIRRALIRPAGVDILWEAHSYTPPLYRGKALAPSFGLIKLTAIPQLANTQGKPLNPKDLVYTWSRRGVVLGNSSGVGKQTIVLTHEAVSLQPFVVNVSVTSFSGAGFAEKTISIPVTDPKILLYQNHGLEKVLYERAITDSFVLPKAEASLRAEPYYFSLDDVVNGLLRYRWRVNGDDISVPLTNQGNEITFGREGSANGSARVSVEIENDNLPFRILQSAEKTITINLENE
jgi:hypothetical protein